MIEHTPEQQFKQKQEDIKKERKILIKNFHNKKRYWKPLTELYTKIYHQKNKHKSGYKNIRVIDTHPKEPTILQEFFKLYTK